MVEVGLGHRWGRGNSAGRWIWRLLVGGALLAFLVLLSMIAQRDRNWMYLRLDDGQHQKVHLSDHHWIEMDGQGQLAYIDPDAKWTFRNLARLMEGDARFFLEENATGFVVDTPSAQIIVQGDQAHFEVRSRTDTTGVWVSLGAVTIAPAESPPAGKRVEASEQAHATSQGIVRN